MLRGVSLALSSQTFSFPCVLVYGKCLESWKKPKELPPWTKNTAPESLVSRPAFYLFRDLVTSYYVTMSRIKRNCSVVCCSGVWALANQSRLDIQEA